MKVANHSKCMLIVAALLLSALPGRAFELTIQTANDPVSNNDHPDDLYTAGVAVDLAFASHRWTLGERMFTDRERQLRFDETFLEMSRELPEWWGWQTEVGAGLLRVGQGLLGERVQNEVHRWVGSEPVHLRYVDHSQVFAMFRVHGDRPLWIGRRGSVVANVEAAITPGFQQSVASGVAAEWSLGREVGLRAGAGARTGHADREFLGDAIEAFGPTWELGLSWRDVTLLYSYNDRGTATSHLTLAVRLGSERRRHPASE